MQARSIWTEARLQIEREGGGGEGRTRTLKKAGRPSAVPWAVPYDHLIISCICCQRYAFGVSGSPELRLPFPAFFLALKGMSADSR